MAKTASGRTEKKKADDENRAYFKDHKASPLSEIEIADTRLPISRVTDEEKRDDIWGGEDRGYLIENTVDEALQRAEAWGVVDGILACRIVEL